jgi:hypothetical protein
VETLLAEAKAAADLGISAQKPGRRLVHLEVSSGSYLKVVGDHERID